MGIIDLKVKATSFVMEQGKFVASKVERTPIAKPTEGPHRYTVYVPHDEAARISIGKAHPLNGEDGIALETQTHIHLSTQSQEEGIWSYLHLGARSARTGHQEYNQKGDGYGFYTNGASSHVAKQAVSLMSQEEGLLIKSLEHMELTSREAGVTINAERHVTARASGNVEIFAGKEEAIAFDAFDTFWGGVFVGVEVFEFFAPLGKLLPKKSEEREAVEAGEVIAKGTNLFQKLTSSRAEEWKEKFIATHAKTASKVLKHAEATTALLLSFKKQLKKTKKNEKGWTDDAGAWFGLAVEATTKIMALASDLTPKDQAKQKAAEEKEEGKVKIKATKGICVDSDVNVSIYAADTVSLAGFMSNSMTGLTTTLKAYKSASMWGGMGATVKALAGDVTMTTDFGEANLKGHAGVEVSSGDGGVKVTGEKHVQINSVKDQLLAHGEKGFYLGAGTGDGQGLIATKTKLEIGCITEGDKFDKVKLDKDHGTITITKIMAAMGNGPDNRLDIKKAGAQLKAAKLDVKTSGPIKINGATVNIN